MRLSDWKWLRQDRTFPWKGGAKIRYRQADQEVEVSMTDDGGIEARFSESQRAVAPGQFFVAYEGDELVGSAVIMR